MDKVTLDGKVYEKSAAVAKRFGYTADYMGQLSRSGKIDAQLVGRSWYVYTPSVEEYQETLYDDDQTEIAEVTEKEKTDQTKNKKNLEPKIRTSRLNEDKFEPRSTTKKSSSRSDLSAARTSSKSPSTPSSNWYRISYEPDSSELLPKLDKKAIDINVFDQSEPAEKPPKPGLRIHCDSPQFSIVETAEKTPEKRRHRTVAVEKGRTSRPNQGFTEITKNDDADFGSTLAMKTPKKHLNRLHLTFMVAILIAVYTSLLVTLLSVRTVAYDASSGTFLYTFQIESLSTFWEAF